MMYQISILQFLGTIGIFKKQKIPAVFLIYKADSVQFSSIISDSLQPHGLQHGSTAASLFITNSQNLLKLMSIYSVTPSNHLIICRSLLLLPSVLPSIRVFSMESVLRIRWPKYWRLSFSISHSNEYSGLISIRIDWFDLRAVQENLKILLQPHISKPLILRCSDFFIIQLSYPYMATGATGKTIALTRRNFVSNVSSF